MTRESDIPGPDGEGKIREWIEILKGGRYNQWVDDWKRQNKKVIGLVDTIFPEEILHAAGLMPYHVMGTRRLENPLTWAWRPVNVSKYFNHVCEAVLSGELAFLDGMVFTDWDDDERRLYDLLSYLKKPPFTDFIHVPHQEGGLASDYFAQTLRKFLSVIEETFHVNVTDQKLWQSIRLYDRGRELLMQLYDWRKREVPPISGTEAAAIVMASYFMPRELYVKELEALVPFLQKRTPTFKKLRPRILVISDHLDDLRFFELIEDEGFLIAMDDLDTGSRYFWKTVGGEEPDPFLALAKRYLSRPPDCFAFWWHKQVDTLLGQIVAWNIDGVLDLPYLGCLDRLCCRPYLTEKLGEAGVPFESFLREYGFANVGQLRTRIGAFREILDRRSAARKERI